MAEQENDKMRLFREESQNLQQMFAEKLGDRDYDAYKRASDFELHLLLRNVGFGLYGSPDEEPDEEKNSNTGYSPEKLEHIRRVYAVIMEHSSFPISGTKDVHIATIFVCLNLEEGMVPVSVFKIPKGKETLFVDSNCRVYKNWKDYLMFNQLPACKYCYPRGGTYKVEDGNVIVDIGDTPANTPGEKVKSVLDSTASAVMLGSLVVSVGALALPVLAPAAAVGATCAMVSGVYGTVRSAETLAERSNHQQSVALSDPEARGCWLNMASSLLGFASSRGVATAAQMASKGQVMSRTGRIVVTALNIGSVAVNGLGVVHGFVVMNDAARGRKFTKLELFQLTSSVLFFTMSAMNVRTAEAIIKETQSSMQQDFEASLRSNRHRKAFRRVAKQTRGDLGDSMEGNAKVIKSIIHIDNKDDFFAGVVRTQKQVGKSRGTMKFSDQGQVIINDELHIDPMRFSNMDKGQRQVILDATRNLKQGTWTQEHFNQQMKTMCQEQKIKFESQRPATLATIDEVIRSSNADGATYNRKLLEDMKVQLVNDLSFCLSKVARDYHRQIIELAIKVADQLECRKTAKVLRVVQFLVDYVEQILAEVERTSQGSDCDVQNYVMAILLNMNTYEGIRMLKDLFKENERADSNNDDDDSRSENERDTSSESPNEKTDSDAHTVPSSAGSETHNNECWLHKEDRDSNEKTDSDAHTVTSSAESETHNNECWLHKEDRDFEKRGDPSNEEIYEIARHVTGLYLFEGNSILSRCDSEAYVSTNDAHIDPITVMVYYYRRDGIVAASVIV